MAVTAEEWQLSRDELPVLDSEEWARLAESRR